MSITQPKSTGATRTGILYSASTSAPGALTLHQRGYGRCVIRFGAPGTGTSYAYSITNRIPQSPDGDASDWGATALATGTASGTADDEVVIVGDYGEIRITCSSPSGSPSYAIHYHLTD